MSWRWEAAEDPGESLVEIELRAIAEGTELTFTHSRLHDEDTRRSHEEGWNGALDKLQRHFSPTIDRRPPMTKHDIVSEEQWIEARRALLAEEKGVHSRARPLVDEAPRAALGHGQEGLCLSRQMTAR